MFTFRVDDDVLVFVFVDGKVVGLGGAMASPMLEGDLVEDVSEGTPIHPAG